MFLVPLFLRLNLIHLIRMMHLFPFIPLHFKLKVIKITTILWIFINLGNCILTAYYASCFAGGLQKALQTLFDIPGYFQETIKSSAFKQCMIDYQTEAIKHMNKLGVAIRANEPLPAWSCQNSFLNEDTVIILRIYEFSLKNTVFVLEICINSFYFKMSNLFVLLHKIPLENIYVDSVTHLLSIGHVWKWEIIILIKILEVKALFGDLVRKLNFNPWERDEFAQKIMDDLIRAVPTSNGTLKYPLKLKHIVLQ